jgi:nitrogenase molybdenum-iron protein beta chain
LGVDPALVKSIADAGESEYYYYIERFADIFLETRVMSKRFTVISDAQYALAITKFLVNDVGLFPGRQYITDNAPEEFRPAIEAAFADLNWGIRAEVEFSSDGWNIHEQVKADDYAGYPLILGSSWEKQLARDTKAHFLAISWPNYERLVINSSYVGYAGGLKLLEDIYSVVLTRYN